MTVENAVGRFVRIPPSQWPELSTAGWVGKIIKMTGKNKVTVQMHDSKQYFTFEHALKSFVPLSA